MKNCSKCSATIGDSDYLCDTCTAKAEEMANVEEMCDIITDDAATVDERRMALHTLVGLLAPDMLNSSEVQVEAEEWDSEQGVPPKPLTKEDVERIGVVVGLRYPTKLAWRGDSPVLATVVDNNHGQLVGLVGWRLELSQPSVARRRADSVFVRLTSAAQLRMLLVAHKVQLVAPGEWHEVADED